MEITSVNAHQALWLLHCRQPGDHTRTRSSWCCYLSAAFINVWWWSAAVNLPSKSVVSLSGGSHTPAIQRPGGKYLLCCRRRRDWSSNELCWGKVTATAAKVSVVLTHECCVHHLRNLENCYSLWMWLILNSLQIRNIWFKIKSKLE